MDYDKEELKADLKTFSKLRANQGKIPLMPIIVKKCLLAFIQFAKDEIFGWAETREQLHFQLET